MNNYIIKYVLTIVVFLIENIPLKLIVYFLLQDIIFNYYYCLFLAIKIRIGGKFSFQFAMTGYEPQVIANAWSNHNKAKKEEKTKN